MSDKSSIMAKLAWRAKWRRRWAKWKKTILILAMLAIITPSFLAFTPWLPQKMLDSIESSKINEITGELNPSAIERMYQMAWFYRITMREKEAEKCYLRVIYWWYGYDMKKWLRMEDQESVVPYGFPEGYTKYVGFCIAELAENYRLHRHPMWASALYQLYLDEWSTQPGADPKHILKAQQYLRDDI